MLAARASALRGDEDALAEAAEGPGEADALGEPGAATAAAAGVTGGVGEELA